MRGRSNNNTFNPLFIETKKKGNISFAVNIPFNPLFIETVNITAPGGTLVITFNPLFIETDVVPEELLSLT